MIIKESEYFRIVTVQAYNGCIPITAYMIQHRQERAFLPDKWVDVWRKAERLFELLK